MIPGLKLLLFRTTLFNMLGGFLWINFQMPPTTTIKKITSLEIDFALFLNVKSSVIYYISI